MSTSGTGRRRMQAAAIAMSAIAAAAAGQAHAEAAYPSRTITFVVAFPPGGPPDAVARIVAPRMSEILGKPIVVENRPGASSSIAATTVARAEPDGHTMLTADLSLVVSPHVINNPPFDPLKDFRLVVMTARTSLTMVIDPKLGIRTPAELVAAAKRDPGFIKAAHSGIGTPPHLGLLSFQQATGAPWLEVPYKGAAQAIQDIVAGHVSLLCTGPVTSIELARAGKVHMLGVTGRSRLADLPDVPTFKESGIDMGGMRDGQYFGIAVPAATADAIVTTINAAANKALEDPGVKEKMAKIAFEPAGGTSEEFTTFFSAQYAYWRDTLAAAKVKVAN